METEERIKALEDEFQQTKNETKQLMLDIRALLMEARSPLRTQSGNGKSSDQQGN
jgi:ribosome-interacting GTPase 1